MAATYRILLAGLRKTDNALALKHFTTTGHVVSAVEELPQAKEHFQTNPPDLVYLQASASSNAVAEMSQMRQLCGETPVVLLTDQPSADLALQLWHEGAADCILLPLSAQALDESLNRVTRRLPAGQASEGKEVQGRLRYLDPAGKEHWAAIIPPKFTIGRSSENDLVFAQMNISRFHAEIVTEERGYVLRDLGSKHGSWVNGSRVEQKVLADGDRIQLGGMQGQGLTFHHGDLLQSLLSISEVSSQAGLSIRGFREMGLLLSTLRALSSISLLDDLLSLVVDTAIDLTGAERGFIMLKDLDGNLSFRCARNNYKKTLDGTSFKTSRRVPNEVFETGTRKVINDLDLTNQGDHSSTRQLGVRSIVCVPLRYWAVHETGADSTSGKVETIGVLYVDSPSIAERLSDTQIDALDTLASEAAMAIYNARLYQVSLEKRKMDEELAIAREIQQSLLPTPDRILPFVRAYSQNLPCREVGGDYFDYFEMEGGRLGFALGDVAGKGMPAALLTSMLQGLFSGQALLNLPLHSLISNVNRNIVRRAPGNRFVTLFFGILDPDGNLTYVNAGHNPPFVVRPDGSLRELTEGGMVLGIFPEAGYQSETVRLGPGDHLVLFTDGVVEARNTSGDEFGEDRLRGLLQAHAKAPSPQILASIQEAVASFSANTPQHDDITMMVVGYREAGEEGAPEAPGHSAFHQGSPDSGTRPPGND